ncbi:uncharacterized protein PV06_03994 [Exophiala oligosperma]|uniref:Atos-like conserved domain-containing protein n=1 Tax=Exophiala oligosperma TaxID=215243 RepID=A0A0D2C756_9EURO|nr:uncharacterized protein PV06_03994 [Exophiala oligosperma]KIW45617.1 hypothetical protein PV06_03994 [Exophiala oligosperma]
MPFVFEAAAVYERPTKKRKITPSVNMARDLAQACFDAEGSSITQQNGLQENFALKERGNEGTTTTPVVTSDREELIQCIKKGQRPTWVPKPGLEALCAEVNAEQKEVRTKLVQSNEGIHPPEIQDSHEWERPTPVFTPSVSATESLRQSLSALHTGDFRDEQRAPPDFGAISTPTRPLAGHPASPPSAFSDVHHFVGTSLSPREHTLDILRRSRAPSLGSSLSSSFVMRVPTSPLVHAVNSPSQDLPHQDSQCNDGSKTSRRQTMPPNAFQSLRALPIDHYPSDSAHQPSTSYPHLDRNILPHRPRRSLSSFTYQPASSPQLHFPGKSRRPSVASDSSPRQRASMVGSFEESILRGRMSTPASKPLDFVAQIGVVGRGNCPPSLKCPAHVTVPFPAVFYNYPSAHEFRSISDDNPSPYVGTIDLEHNLNPPEPPTRRLRRAPAPADPEDSSSRDTSETGSRKPSRSKVPTGGAYRVPQQGQLQIIIKNPNKTAVKLFLIPYDLEGMTQGTKTFVRQRSFSSGPILENALTETRVNPSAYDPLSNKDILRYLIHLKFCSTGKGRFYLYDNIRVVFANRVPDGKEKLRNEVQLPEPRFSPYKPADIGSRSPSLSEQKFSISSKETPYPEFGSMDGMLKQHVIQSGDVHDPSSMGMFYDAQPRESALVGLNIVHRNEERRAEVDQSVSPVSGFLPSTSSRSSPVPWLDTSGNPVARGLSPAPLEVGDGLISRKLRELNGSAARPL